MRTLGQFVGISKQTEVLFLVLAGICCTIFDASLFNLHTNLYKVWSAPMDPTKFTDTAQLYVKYILSSIVLVRTFTVHLYLAFYIVMLWPAIFEEKAGLLLPWLMVGAVKCLAMGAMSFSTGLYICLAYRFSKAACWDFMIAQIIDQTPSIYMWFCILSYYYDISRKDPDVLHLARASSHVFTVVERKRRPSLAYRKLKNSFEDNRQLISVSAIDNVINKLSTCLRRGASRSLDSMLDRLTAEAQKEEILNTLNDENPEEDKDLSVAERTLKLLNLSKSYVVDKKDRDIVVRSSPLIKRSKHGVKVKSIDHKIFPKKSEELSYIMSETEIKSTGFAKVSFCKNVDGIYNAEDPNNTGLRILSKFNNEHYEMQEIPSVKVEELHVNIFKDKASEDVALGDSSNDMHLERKLTGNHSKESLELKELHVTTIEDDVSENTAFYTHESELVPIPGTSSQQHDSLTHSARNRSNKIDDRSHSAQVPTTLKASSPVKVSPNKKSKKIEPKKANQKTYSTSKAAPKVPRLIPQNLKSRSQDAGYNKALLPTFKYDGYTLAYMESQQRKATAALMKNRRRPNSSGV